MPAAVSSAPVLSTGNRKKKENAQERKRREADIRKRRSKVIAPLQKKVEETEKRIGELEESQAECSSQLADPAVYDDEKKRNELLASFQKGAQKLDELNLRWEHQLAALEEATAELDAM